MTEDELILTHILGISRSEFYLKKPLLTDQQEQQFEIFKARRSHGEPLQYILGVCDFMGLEFKVDPRVLIPRSETEILVDVAIQKIRKDLSFPNVSIGNLVSGSQINTFGPACRTGRDDKRFRILDIGTGSGCIAITLAKQLPHTHITTVDISQEALALAKENAITHGVEQQIDFIHAHILDYVGTRHAVPLQFDLIISNPPYIPSSDLSQLPRDVQQEPRLALDGGVDGLDFYRFIIKIIPGLIRLEGCLMMEFGDGQENAIKSILEAPQIFSKIQIYKDLTGKNRIVCASN